MGVGSGGGVAGWGGGRWGGGTQRKQVTAAASALPRRAETTKRHLNSAVQCDLCNEVPLIMGAFRAHAGLRSWGPAPRGQLMVMSPSVRSLPSTPAH